jgi:hypothetical protein
MELLKRQIMALCVLTSVVSCDSVNTRPDHATRPEIYAAPYSGSPDITSFPDRNGRTGRTLTTTFAGEVITHHWKQRIRWPACCFARSPPPADRRPS